MTWAITNKQDINTFEAVFKAVKIACHQTDVYTVITDDGKI